MATDIVQLVQRARYHLNEATEDLNAGFWTDDELAALMDACCRDLWRAINDNYQHYFVTVDETNVSLAANSSTLTGVPADVAIVRGLEPRVLTSRPGLVFEHRDYNHIDFVRARSMDAQDPSYGLKVFYCLMGQGAPIAAPTVRVAPQINAAVTLRLIYVPTLATVEFDSTNPIPGESDNAIVAWCVAYAMAKQAEDQQPDAGWLKIYATEKQNILTSLTPRQTDDEELVEAMFEDYWQ